VLKVSFGLDEGADGSEESSSSTGVAEVDFFRIFGRLRTGGKTMSENEIESKDNVDSPKAFLRDLERLESLHYPPK